MAQETIPMSAEARTPGTKNDARRVRAGGHVPAVLYGGTGQALPIAIDPKPLLAVLHSAAGHNRILNLSIGSGETTSAVLKAWQIDPVSDRLLHVDFQRIDLSKKLTAKVPVHTVGEAKGVKMQGGILELVFREIEVECLPLDIPDSIELDVVELVVGKNIRVRDLVVDPKIIVLSNPDQLVAHVVVMKEEEVKAADETAVVAAAAEPEVLKKGKKEEEGAEEGKKDAGKGDKKK